jgi:CRISPR system Cascade subunit CasC
MNNRTYVDIHILQTVPPSCINRDDTGSPKTAVYGGATRARVSSQAWKKAVRDLFREEILDSEEMGVRTKRVLSQVSDAIKQLPNCPENPDALAEKILTECGFKKDHIDGGKAAPLFFMSPAQAKALAEYAVENSKFDKKQAQAALNSEPSIDLALFGRMVADDANLNIDASCQVAHAISTHKISTEYDYFTAVDDFPEEEKTDAGAAMIGTIEYNSSTLYRYATVAVHDLSGQLGGEAAAAKAVREFADAFARSMPTGKQNTFANRTLPDAIYVAIRRDQPLNLVGAFEKPITARGGYVEESGRRFVEFACEKYAEGWVKEPETALYTGKIFEGLGEGLGFDELLCRLEDKLS